MKVRAATLAILALAVVGLVSPASAQTLNELSYQVTRDGSDIGTHAITIADDGDTRTVTVKTDIAVKVFFVTAYQFTQDSTETWKNGKLVALTSTTHDDNDPEGAADWTLSIGLGDAGLKAVGTPDKGEPITSTTGADTLPASLWHPATVEQDKLINTIHGKVMNISVAKMGEEMVGDRAATHYSITGDLARELWIDKDGNVVKYTFLDSTDSLIAYTLR